MTRTCTSLVSMLEILTKRYTNVKFETCVYGNIGALHFPITATNNAGCLLVDEKGKREFYIHGHLTGIQCKFNLLLEEHNWLVQDIIGNEKVILIPNK